MFKEPVKVAKEIVFQWMYSPNHMELTLLSFMIHHPEYNKLPPALKEATAMFCGQIHTALRVSDKSQVFAGFITNMSEQYNAYKEEKDKPKKRSIELDGVLVSITIQNSVVILHHVRPDILSINNIAKISDCVNRDKSKTFITLGSVETHNESVTVGFNVTPSKTKPRVLF